MSQYHKITYIHDIIPECKRIPSTKQDTFIERYIPDISIHEEKFLPKIYVVTFSHNCCEEAKKYNKEQCLKHGATKVFDLNLDTLVAPEYVKEYIRTSKRGAGYWCWKPYAILQILNKPEVNQGDIVFYMDAGTYPNISLEKSVKFINKHNILCFKLPNLQNVWTKADAVSIFDNMDNFSQTFGKQGQIMAGFVAIKKNELTYNLINQWKDLMKPENSHYYDDSKSNIPNHESFNESRHDQMMLSLLLYYKYNYIIKDLPGHNEAKTKFGLIFHEDINGKDRYA